MQVKRLTQFSAGFNLGDAISNEMLMIKFFFQSRKIPCELYSENIGNGSGVKKFNNYSPTNGDLIIYHHSIHSNVLEFLLDLADEIPKSMIYHNVTPDYFLQNYDLRLSYFLKKGREELIEIRENFFSCFADSEYNKRELESMGYRQVNLLPIFYDFNKIKKSARPENKKVKDLVFVGRIAPNKKQDDLIRIAAILKKHYTEDFRFHLVGNTSLELTSYKNELELMIDFYGLKSNVLFSNFIDDSTLWEYYRKADIFICMSEHEGFCVPLIESMFFEIPILAFDAGAVRDTLKGSGVLFTKKNFVVIAELIVKTLEDKLFRDKIIRKQNEVLNIYKNANQGEILWNTFFKTA